jgi:hypothetical protein
MDVEVGQVRQTPSGKSHRVVRLDPRVASRGGIGACHLWLGPADKLVDGPPTCKHCLRKEASDG